VITLLYGYISVICDQLYNKPAPVAARSKGRMVLSHSNIGIVGSNLIRGMDV